MTLLLPSVPQAEPRTPGAVHSRITWGLGELGARAVTWRMYLDYYNGLHRLAFATDKWRTQFGTLFKAFADNLCPAVVDAKADRLQVSGFAAFPDDPAAAGQLTSLPTGEGSSRRVPDEVAGALVQDLWDRNRMDKAGGHVPSGGAAGGRGVRSGLAAPGEQPGRGAPEPGERDGRALRRRPTGRHRGGREDLATAGRARHRQVAGDAVLPGRRGEVGTTADKSDTLPEKAEGKFVLYADPTGPNPLPNPYDTVPVFPFVNNAVDGEMGRSELDTVIPLQDALNKSVADMLVAMEFQSLPQRWATGLELEYETDASTGEQTVKKPFVPGADRICRHREPQRAVRPVRQRRPEDVIAVSDSLRAEMARTSRTPLHYLLLSGTFPSGEALHAAESPLLAAVNDRQIAFGNTSEGIMGFAYRLEASATVVLAVNWQDTRTIGDKEKAEAVQARLDIHGSKTQAQRELGYSDDQIAEMEEDAAESAAAVAGAAMSAFDSGAATGFEGAAAIEPEVMSTTITGQSLVTMAGPTPLRPAYPVAYRRQAVAGDERVPPWAAGAGSDCAIEPYAGLPQHAARLGGCYSGHRPEVAAAAAAGLQPSPAWAMQLDRYRQLEQQVLANSGRLAATSGALMSEASRAAILSKTGSSPAWRWGRRSTGHRRHSHVGAAAREGRAGVRGHRGAAAAAGGQRDGPGRSRRDAPHDDTAHRTRARRAHHSPADAGARGGCALTRAMTITRTEITGHAGRRPCRACSRTTRCAAGCWRCALDENCCAACIALHGREFNTYQPMQGHPNCRCVTSPCASAVSTPTWATATTSCSGRRRYRAGWSAC